MTAIEHRTAAQQHLDKAEDASRRDHALITAHRVAATAHTLAADWLQMGHPSAASMAQTAQDFTSSAAAL